jgi:hypothetical protein
MCCKSCPALPLASGQITARDLSDVVSPYMTRQKQRGHVRGIGREHTKDNLVQPKQWGGQRVGYRPRGGDRRRHRRVAFVHRSRRHGDGRLARAGHLYRVQPDAHPGPGRLQAQRRQAAAARAEACVEAMTRPKGESGFLFVPLWCLCRPVVPETLPPLRQHALLLEILKFLDKVEIPLRRPAE